MLTIEKIDTTNKSQTRRFVDMPYHLYADCPQWVPPIRLDMYEQLDRNKHPFYEHSECDFFLAVKDGKDVGRITAIENRSYNNYHNERVCFFYHYEAEDNFEISVALFDAVEKWATERNLVTIMGPKGLGPLDGYGIQVEGFEHRQMMTMMLYNHPYIVEHIEKLGFQKEVDFVSCYIGKEKLKVSERVHRIADRVQERGKLRVLRFKNKKELSDCAPRIGIAYNNTFVENWEYYPLSDKEVDYILESILTIADPRLVKILVHGEKVIGFLLGFADISEAIQKSGGYLLPSREKLLAFGILNILYDLKFHKSNWIALNGMGVLPGYQGRGGNALLYSEMEKTVGEYNFEFAEMTQIAESATQMRSDLINLGGIPYKNHRVYRKDISLKTDTI